MQLSALTDPAGRNRARFSRRLSPDTIDGVPRRPQWQQRRRRSFSSATSPARCGRSSPDRRRQATARPIRSIAGRGGSSMASRPTVGAAPIYPFGGPPYWPFQRWAQRAEAVFPSPLGILIHPEYGLWHAYRAALACCRIDRLAAAGRGSVALRSCAGKTLPLGLPGGRLQRAGFRRRRLHPPYRPAGRPDPAWTGAALRAMPARWPRRALSGPQTRFHMAAFRRARQNRAPPGRSSLPQPLTTRIQA